MSDACPRCAAPVAPGARFCGRCGACAAPPAPERAASPLIGRELNGRYRIEQQLGQGGFGTVFRGLQLHTGRPVAIKILHPQMTSDASLVARFRREAQLACSLRDAHTVVTYDFDQTADEVLYLVMELLEGRSLQAELAEGRPVAPDRAARIADQLCGSLAEAHGQGIVHRDIKPENIILEDRPGSPDFVKVLDFGIAKIMTGDGQQTVAKLTAAGMTVGTLEYMSPEQLRGAALDGRSDIYALGVLLYQLLTGRLPFSGPPPALILDQLEKAPTPPSAVNPTLPAGLDQLVLRCLAKDPRLRYADTIELRAALRPHATGVPAPAPTPAPVAASPAIPSPAARPAPGARPAAASPPGPRPMAAGGRRSGVTVWLIVGAFALLGLGTLAVGLYLTLFGDEDGEPTKVAGGAGLGDASAGGAKPKTKTKPPADDPRQGLMRLVSPTAGLIAQLSPRRLLAVPGFREGWTARLPATARLMLTRSGTRPERIERLLVVAPEVPAAAWRGSTDEIPSAVALRGVDPDRVLGLLAEQGWRREGPLRRQGLLAATRVGPSSLVAGQLVAVRAALDARQLSPSDVAEATAMARTLTTVGGKAPLFAAQLRVPAARRAGLGEALGGAAEQTLALAAGAERRDGLWILRGAVRTRPGAASDARLALGRWRDRLVRGGAATAAQRKALAAIAITAAAGDLTLLSLRLTDGELERLVLEVQAGARGGGGILGGELPSR